MHFQGFELNSKKVVDPGKLELPGAPPGQAGGHPGVHEEVTLPATKCPL